MASKILCDRPGTTRQASSKKGDGEYRRLIFNAARAAGRFGFRPYMERFKDRGMKSA